MRLIDAESTQNRLYVSDYVAEQMKKIPTVDAVPVVRCKDCIYATIFDGSDVIYCMNSYGIQSYVADDDFCSYGERKENERS